MEEVSPRCRLLRTASASQVRAAARGNGSSRREERSSCSWGPGAAAGGHSTRTGSDPLREPGAWIDARQIASVVAGQVVCDRCFHGEGGGMRCQCWRRAAKGRTSETISRNHNGVRITGISRQLFFDQIDGRCRSPKTRAAAAARDDNLSTAGTAAFCELSRP